MNNISPLASVSPKAIIGDNVEIGPFAYVDDDVEIGDGCKIFPHATVFQYVKMGKNCQIYPGAVVGAVPQDLKFEGEITSVELGDNVTVRECATNGLLTLVTLSLPRRNWSFVWIWHGI